MEFIFSAYYPKFDPERAYMVECFIKLDEMKSKIEEADTVKAQKRAQMQIPKLRRR